jgi:integrase
MWHLDAATAGRCGELFGLRWGRVSFTNCTVRIAESFTRNRIDTPKSRQARTLELGPLAIAILAEQWGDSAFTGDDDLVFCHPQLGTHLDPAKVRRNYVRPALRRAGIPEKFKPFHDLRHTALTHDATIHALAIVQAKAGHAHGSTTERYVHLAGVKLEGAAAASEARLFGTVPENGGGKVVERMDRTATT